LSPPVRLQAATQSVTERVGDPQGSLLWRPMPNSGLPQAAQ
jgi:hypothetical protein